MGKATFDGHYNPEEDIYDYDPDAEETEFWDLDFENAEDIPHDELMNPAFDESGCEVSCTCGGAIFWEPELSIWRCSDCGQVFDRSSYFDYIGADPPSMDCRTGCSENYPLCRETCPFYLAD